MTLEERAAYIADEANECCGRSDGYRDDIYKIALTMLQEVVAEQFVTFEHVADSGTIYSCEIKGPQHIVITSLSALARDVLRE